MRITRHSPQHITIHSSDAVTLMVGFIFVIAAAGMLLTFGKKVTLDCDRSRQPAASCSMVTTSFIDRKSIEITLADIQQAVVAVSTSDDDDTYRVVLVTTWGSIPLTSYYSSGYSSKQEMADEINAYLITPSQKSLSVKTDDRLFMAIIAGIFGGAGLAMGLFSGTYTFDLDRTTGLLTTKRRSLFTKRDEELMIGDLRGADVEASSKSVYRVVLRLRDGRSIPLTSYYSSGYEPKRKLAEELQTFAEGGGYAPQPDTLFPG